MAEFFIAIGLLLGTGAVCAVILALVSKYFGVEVDERQTKVREALPGANCGACGYTGCDGYAEALAKGEAEPHLCVPGAKAVAEKIAEILGVEAGEVAELVPYIHCNGGFEASERPAEYEGFDSCEVMNLAGGGATACKYSCLGGGDCAAVCPTNAICIKDGVARIDRRKCISCGKCVKACPKHIIDMVPKDYAVAGSCASHDKGAVARKNCKNACIACGKCEKNCPNGAIKVIDNLATVDYSLCTGCGICADVCPTGCIAKRV